MRWPWRKMTVFSVGDVYEIGAPTIRNRKRVRLMQINIAIDGTIRAEFDPLS